MAKVTYWQAMGRAAEWRRVYMQKKLSCFAEVAHDWIELARWMREHNVSKALV